VSSHLPSEETAMNLLEKAGCSKKVIAHCRAVADLAVEIANACREKGLKIDVDLVWIGGLLHDIGRAKTHGVDHGVMGANIARNFNLSGRLVNIIERHIGSGITEEEARKSGLPVKNYIPVSLEERVVAYADKLIEGSTRLPFDVAVERFRRDKNIPEVAVERLKQWHIELATCLE
jgi:uncharacterized protein